MAHEIMEKIVTIETAYHKGGTLMVATSPELRGLIVHGRSEAELSERVPVAIRALMEADGFVVQSVKPVSEDAFPMPPAFVAAPRKFQAVVN